MFDDPRVRPRPPIGSKPPIGLKPRSTHDSERMTDIINAMARYAATSQPIPEEWIHELKALDDRRMI